MKEKKLYKRPRVKKIILKTDEQVLGVCKYTTIGGPNADACVKFDCVYISAG